MAPASLLSSKAILQLSHKQFNLIRYTLVTGWLVVLLFSVGYGLDLPYFSLATILAIHTFLISFSALYPRFSTARSIPQQLAATNLIIDIVFNTTLLYFSGGWTNPLVSLYLITIILSATTLPRKTTLVVTLLAISGYTLVSQTFHPVQALNQTMSTQDSTTHVSGFSLHMAGMWFTFVISALAIAVFISNLAQAQRATEARLASSRERNLRAERVLGMATLAAGTAHELGTPLSTLTLLATELANDVSSTSTLAELDKSAVEEDLADMQHQLFLCKQILGQLSERANQGMQNNHAPIPLSRFMAQLLDKWQLMHPESVIDYQEMTCSPDPTLRTEESLALAIHNLLENARKVSPQHIALHCRWDTEQLDIEILDRGPGITDNLKHFIANAESSSPIHQPMAKHASDVESKGLGIGLLLVNATIESFQGQVRFYNRKNGGARVLISIPLANLLYEESHLGEDGSGDRNGDEGKDGDRDDA